MAQARLCRWTRPGPGGCAATMRKLVFIPCVKACCNTSCNGYVGDICKVNSSSSFPVQMTFLASALDKYTLKRNAAEKSFQLLSMEFFLFPLCTSFKLTVVRGWLSHSNALHEFCLLPKPCLLWEVQRGLGPLSVLVPESWTQIPKQSLETGPGQT